MNYYNLIKLNQKIKNHRLKFLGILILHILKRRYLAVFFDPVNACNLRCKMCYFTDKDYTKRLKGIFPPKDIDTLAESLFSRSIKLQIGCGTEPTLYNDITRIIEAASKYDVPHISLTTNGNLLKKELLENWISKGLSEIIISLHGVKKDTYEYMMGNGKFDLFLHALQIITELKKVHPVKLRINYTFNEDNFKELETFFEVFDSVKIDILQIRPIVKIGNTEYNNFSMTKIIPHYERIYSILLNESIARGTTFLSHSPVQLVNRKSVSSVINKYVYAYISPTSLYHEDFKWGEESYDEYANRTGLKGKLWKDIFRNKKVILQSADDKLNYDVIN